MTAKFDGRMGWVVGAVGLIAAGGIAMGFSTPGEKIAEVKKEQKGLSTAFQESQKVQAAKDSEQDIRLERLELMGDRIEDIADKVGAERRERRRRGGR